MCTISYIIPFYNGGDTIRTCLNSILSLKLDYSLYEIIVVDDCSPVSAQDILSDYLDKYCNISIIRHSNNTRQGGAKNTGIKAARGKYIAFADQDDTIDCRNISEVLPYLLESDPDMVACKWREFYRGKETVCGPIHNHPFSVSGKQYCEDFFDPSCCLAPWSYFYKRTFLLETNRPMAENVLAEDADWIAWHLFYASNILFLPIIIYNWNIIYNSTSHNYDYKTKADFVKYGYRKILDSYAISSTSEKFANYLFNDGKHNIEGTFKNLWKANSYSKFYLRLGSEYLVLLRTIQWPTRIRFFIFHPKVSCVALTIIGPPLKLMCIVKNKLCR